MMLSNLSFIKGNLKILCPTKTIDLMGEFKGGSAPQDKNGGIYKLKAYSKGGWGKQRKINNLRIIGQSNLKINLCFKILNMNIEKDINKYNEEIVKLQSYVQISENVSRIVPYINQTFNGLYSVLNNYILLKGYSLKIEEIRIEREYSLGQYQSTISYLISLNNLTTHILKVISDMPEDENKKIFIEQFLKFSELINQVTSKILEKL